MKKLVYLMLLLFASCSILDETNPIKILKKYTTIDFKSGEIKELSFDKKISGMLGGESNLIAVHQLSDKIDLKVMRKELEQAGFKPIPININDGVIDGKQNKFYSDNDIGLYKINFRPKENIQEWIVFNFTKMQIVLDVDF
jgi:hypothetical protein